jgi:hypothetical protein
MFDGGGDFPRDVGDTRVGTERVRRNRDRIVEGERTLGEMRPEGFVEGLPEAAVDEDDETEAIALGEEEIPSVARRLPIGKIEPRAEGAQEVRAEGGGARGPLLGVARAALDMRRIGVGVVPIGDGIARRVRRAQSSVLTCQSSGKRTTSSIRRRYATPDVPPVPRLKPITRSTVVT